MQRKFFWAAVAVMLTGATAFSVGLAQSPIAGVKPGVGVQPLRVRIEAMFIEVDLTETETTLLASLNNGRTCQTPGVQSFAISLPTETCMDLIHGFETQRRAFVVSGPRVRTENNQTTRVVFGQKSFFSHGEPRPQSKEYDAGIEIEMTPKIVSDGAVAVRLAPAVKGVARLKFDVSNGVLGTVYNLQALDTTIIIPEGQTAILSGVFDEQDVATEHRTPMLSDLPLVGAAFRHEMHQKKKTQMLMFITPHVEVVEVVR